MVRPRGRVDEEFIRIRRSTASTTARWRICPSDSGFTTSDTFLTRLGHSSADAFTIMKAAGHGSVVISQRYVHPTPERLETALTNLEAYNKQQSAELAEMGPERPDDHVYCGACESGDASLTFAVGPPSRRIFTVSKA